MASLPPVDRESNIVARFAELVATPGDRDGAILSCITAVGAHLGRSSALAYRNRKIYGTLYSAIIGPPSTASDWSSWFSELPKAPLVTRSGISHAESLVYLVRDRVRRPDKIFTGQHEDPQWRLATVDAGVVDKRRLIMQALGSELATKKNVTARRLLDTLNVAYENGELSAYLNYRDGGFHGARAAHISLLMSESDVKIAAAVWERMPLLLARAQGPAVDTEGSMDIWDILSDIQIAIQNAPAEVTIAPGGKYILESEARSQRPYAVLTLLRLAHILAVLEGSPVVTESLLIQAPAIVGASESVYQQLCNQNRVFVTEEILRFVTTNGGVCSKDDIGDRFRRKYAQREIDSVLAELEQSKRLLRELVKTNGRTRENWRQV